MHEQYLDENYFPLVMQIPRYPRYKNKRNVDPHVKLYLDEANIAESPDWGLPIPNEEAAYKSLSKYAKDIIPMSEQEVKNMNLAWEWTAKHFGVYMAQSKVRTVKEVIAQLDMNTSSGAPFNIRYPTKKELFLEFPEMEQWLEEDWELLASDPHYTFLFTSSLKEEIRPADKIAANKIRTFLAGAVDGTVHGNRLFADMNEKMNASHLKSASGVGMSPYGGNWDRLYRKLNIFRKGYALDESEYDSSLRAYMMWSCAYLRWKMLAIEFQTRANFNRLRTYYRNLVNSLIVTAAGVLVFKMTGNPSGSVNTINDNTLILYALLAYAWITLCDEDPSYAEFEDNTSKVLVGDDNTWTVSEWAHEFFNARSVIATWNKIGVTTTTDSLEPRTAKELDFLSAHTIFYHDQAVPVYDRTKLMTSLLYAPVSHHTPAVTLTRAAALLTVGWTDTQFRKFSRELIEWLMCKYDTICANDPEWIQAKSGILTDARLSKLFLGHTVMYIQSVTYSEVQERSKPLNKVTMSQMIVTKKSRSQRGKGAKATRKNKQGAILVQGSNQQPVTFVVQKPKKKQAAPRQQRRQRQRRNFSVVVKGRGAYTMNPEDSYGKQWGGYVGSHLGELAGGAAQGLATTFITGLGKYENVSNALQPGLLAPVMNKNPHNGMVARGCEYLGDIISSATPGDFNLQSFMLNPAKESSFPKLAQQACNFDEYVLEGIYYEFRTMTGNTAANPAMGTVVMAANYNPAAPQFTSKAVMEEYDGAVSTKASESCLFFLECDRRESLMDVLLTRSEGIPTGQDPRFYDFANVQVATVGVPLASQNLGELWVSYQFALLKPKLYSSLGNFQTYFGWNSTANTDGPLAAGNILYAQNNSTGFFISPTELTFPMSPLPQSYLVVLQWTGTPVIATFPDSTFNNCTNYFQPTQVSGGHAPSNGQTTDSMIDTFCVTVPGNLSVYLGASVSFGTSGTLPGSAQVHGYVIQLPNLITGA